MRNVNNRRARSLCSHESPPQIQAGAYRLPEGGLCKSYAPLLARSSNTPKSFPTRIAIARITVPTGSLSPM